MSNDITEDYVSFEIAKLLKEKGYEQFELHKCMYDINGNVWWGALPTGLGYERPTLQRAMKWLREVHKIHIQIWILEEKGYWFNIEKILNAQYKHKSLYSTGLEDIYFDTYEEAVKAGFKYCLENLI